MCLFLDQPIDLRKLFYNEKCTLVLKGYREDFEKGGYMIIIVGRGGRGGRGFLLPCEVLRVNHF